MTTRNWTYDGWSTKDWNSITDDADGLTAITAQLHAAIGGGGGGFTPAELKEFAERIEMTANRLKRIQATYI